jgi:hypothetical protein
LARTHKLKGKLKNSWACSAGYDLRIVFQCVRHQQNEAILLEAAGTHDAVYRANKEGGPDYRAGVKTSDAGGKFPDRDKARRVKRSLWRAG